MLPFRCTAVHYCPAAEQEITSTVSKPKMASCTSDMADVRNPKNRQILLMDKARASASFDSRQLTYFLWEG